jgi:hypothetical protein
MNRTAVTVAASAFFALAPLAGANAAPVGSPDAIRTSADGLNLIERAQFIWLGRNYCWYDDGWNGPGWYWCGQYTVPGIGWGGGYGWHGWRGGHPGGGRPGYRRGGRPGVSHPGPRSGPRPHVARPAISHPGGGPRGGHPGGGPRGGHPGGGHPGGGHSGGGRSHH